MIPNALPIFQPRVWPVLNVKIQTASTSTVLQTVCTVEKNDLEKG